MNHGDIISTYTYKCIYLDKNFYYIYSNVGTLINNMTEHFHLIYWYIQKYHVGAIFMLI